MDFDPERQEFTLTEREQRLLRLHPAWGVVKVENAAQLHQYVARQADISNFNALPGRARRKVEIRRHLAARDVAQVIMGQLETFMNDGPELLADLQVSTSEPLPGLE